MTSPQVDTLPPEGACLVREVLDVRARERFIAQQPFLLGEPGAATDGILHAGPERIRAETAKQRAQHPCPLSRMPGRPRVCGRTLTAIIGAGMTLASHPRHIFSVKK